MGQVNEWGKLTSPTYREPTVFFLYTGDFPVTYAQMRSRLYVYICLQFCETLK